MPDIVVIGKLGMNHTVTTPTTADLTRRRVQPASAAVCGVGGGQPAVHHAAAAARLPRVEHGRSAAVRVRPEQAVADLSRAAYLRRLVVRLVAAARVMHTCICRTTGEQVKCSLLWGFFLGGGDLATLLL